MAGRPYRRKYPSVQSIDELKDLCDTSTDCWLYPYGSPAMLYGCVYYEDNRFNPHVLSMLLTTGQRPSKTKHVLHTCDIKRCCNPKHLYIGSPRDNIIDMYARNPTIRENIAKVRRGTTLSEETKRRVGEASRNRYYSPETRAKMSSSMLGKNVGRKMSAEVIERRTKTYHKNRAKRLQEQQ